MSAQSSTSSRLLPVAGGRRTGREVWRLSRGHRLKLVAVVVLGVGSAMTGLVAPAVVGTLIDRVEAGTAGLPDVLWALAIMVVAAFIGALGTAVTVVLAARSYQAMLAELREELVGRAMSLPQSVVERAGAGDLISRSSDDVAQVADAAPQIIPVFTGVVFTIIVTIGGMAALDPWYALTVAVLLPVYVVTVRWYLATGPRVYRAERAAMSVRAQELTESQRGHETILGLGLREVRHEAVITASWGVVGHSLRAKTVVNMFAGRLNVAEYLGMATILIVGFVLIGTEASSIGAATTAMLLFLRLFGPIGQLLGVIDTLQSVLASLSRMVGVIAMPAEAGDRDPGSAEADDRGRGPAEGGEHLGEAGDGGVEGAAVELTGVSFGYDGGEPAIAEIEVRVDPGERVAVVGASGAGKTTLAAIVAGIHRPDSGVVTRPRLTAVITQEYHVFAGTLRENLTLAAPSAGDDEIRAALAMTGASGFLDRLTEGLDTVVGTGGVELTPAQAQQLALARIVLLDPDLAILDEATAEAGSAHAGVLDSAAEAVLRGRTGLVIAHRLDQAAAGDRVIVMDHGRIVESGGHDELREAGGIYSGLWQAWSRAQG